MRCIKLASFLVSALATVSVCHAQGLETPAKSVGDIQTLIETFSQGEQAGYELFYKPTAPPERGVTQAIPQFDNAGLLVLVYLDQSPIIEIVTKAIDMVPVLILVENEEELELVLTDIHSENLSKHLKDNRLEIIVLHTDSIWIRDYGPIYVLRGDNEPVAMDAIYIPTRPAYDSRVEDEIVPFFLGGELDVPTYRPPINLAGGNFDADGHGLCVTSTTTIRNNGGNRELTDSVLSVYYGCDKVIYLEHLPGPTTGHIDMFFRIAAPDIFLLGSYERRPSPRTAREYFQKEARARMERNYQTLKKMEMDLGREIRIERVPMPDIGELEEGSISDRLGMLQLQLLLSDDPEIRGLRQTIEELEELGKVEDGSLEGLMGQMRPPILYRSYLNYLHLKSPAGEVVLIPDYPRDIWNTVNKKRIEEVFQRVYPNARLRYVDSDALIEGQGALHCITLVPPEVAARSYMERFHPVARDVVLKERVIARWADGQPIPLSEVVREFQRTIDLYKYSAIGDVEGALTDLVRYKLWDSAVDTVISRSVTSRALERARVFIDLTEVKEIAKILAGDNWAQEPLRDYFEQQAKDQQAVELVTREFGAGQDEITQAHVETYYMEHRSHFYEPGEYRAAYVALRVPAPERFMEGIIDPSAPGDEAPIKNVVETVRAALRDHSCEASDSITVPSEVSDVATAMESGIVEESEHEYLGDLPADVQYVVMNILERDEISDPIPYRDTVWIVRLCDRREGRVRALEEVEDGIRRELVAQGRDRVLERLREGLEVFDIEPPEPDMAFLVN